MLFYQEPGCVTTRGECKAMALDLSDDRQQAHAYLDRLPPEQLSTVLSLLETMLDPVTQSIANFPVENEEISEEEERSVAEAREWLEHNKAIPMRKALRRTRPFDGRFREDGPHAASAGFKRRGRLTMAKKIAWAEQGEG